MAVPGLRPTHEVRAKVRIGEKREGTTQGGKTYTRPASVDYFICDDPGWLSVVPERSSTVRIVLPHADVDANFSTGLEQWAGKMLVCYAKGETVGQFPVAWRKQSMKKDGRDVNLLDGFDVVTDRTIGQDRAGVHCLSRDCAVLRAGECKPMGRLQFFLPGLDPTDGVFQIDTKSWNSIEAIEGLLSVIPHQRGKELLLKVEMRTRGRDHFPVLSLEVPDVQIDTPADAVLADAYVQLRAAVDDESVDPRRPLMAVLDITTPAWRDNQELLDRLRTVGSRAAGQKMLERVDL